MKAVSAMALAIVVRRLVTVMRLMVSSIGVTECRDGRLSGSA
jgi:hypothetical protein